MMGNNYEVIVGNAGTMQYENYTLAKECYDTYVRLSKDSETRVSNEPVTLMKDGEIIAEYIPEDRNSLID